MMREMDGMVVELAEDWRYLDVMGEDARRADADDEAFDRWLGALSPEAFDRFLGDLHRDADALFNGVA